jgi:heme-degrading monooxygenase HmoA
VGESLIFSEPVKRVTALMPRIYYWQYVPILKKYMIIQLTKFKSTLSDEEADQVMHERSPSFREVAGLIQKYYIKDEKTGERGAVYVWESEAAMLAFRQTELAQSLNEAYQVEGEKRVEIFDLALVLRD